jgi:spermidine synthase
MLAQRSALQAPLFFVGLFLTCMCCLMLQIIETRILSVIAFYHLAFFAISMAMFGMTAGSLLIYFKARLFPPEHLFANLSWIGSWFSVAVVVSTLLMISMAVVSTTHDPGMSVLLWLNMIAILVPPYVFAGMAVSLALTRSPWQVGLVYGVDMIGAASGCLIVLALLQWLDGVSALIAVGAIAAAGAACFAAARRVDTSAAAVGDARASAWVGPIRHPAALAALFAILAGANAAIQPYGLRLSIAHNRVETDATPSAMRWNSFSRVKAAQEEFGPPAMWGPSPRMPSTLAAERYMDIDGDAGTAIYRFLGNLAELDFLRYDVTNLAYAIRGQGRAAIIGVGGGRDLLSAYVYGFRDVTGVELNPIFVDLLTNRFRNYNHLADLPGLRLFVDEARSWFARTPERFDLIQMSLVDTWAATGAGAFSLSENGLYTVEGWRHFLGALMPNGVFTVSRWYDPNNVNETGRLLSLAVAALRDRGIHRPDTHIFVAGTDRLATLIVSLSPLAADDLARLQARVDELGFKVLLSPDHPGNSVLQQILQARDQDDMAELSRINHMDLTAPTDNRPFFFNQLILTDPQSLALAFRSGTGARKGNLLATATVATIVILSAGLVLITMIVPTLPSVRQTSGWLASFGTLYFALLGLGFMFIEIGLIQRASVFLGHPVYGLAVGLFGIIIATGLGALISERLRLDSGSRIMTWAVALGLYLLVMPLWLPSLLHAFEGQDLLGRIGVSIAALMPPGVLMGFGFPAGMRLVSAIDTRPTPWFWAVNGAAGVLASSLAVFSSMAFSVNVSLVIGACCYFLLGPVGAALHRGGWEVVVSSAGAR